MRRATIAALIALVLGAVLVSGCGSGGTGEVTTDATSAPIPAASSPASRSTAPAFAGTTVDGRQVSLEGYKGKPLVLVFWGSW